MNNVITVTNLITMHDIENYNPSPSILGAFLDKLAAAAMSHSNVITFECNKAPHGEWAEVTYKFECDDMKFAYDTAYAIEYSVYSAGGFY